MAMTSSVITLAGIERALGKFNGSSVFDDWKLPANIDKDLAKDSILLRAGSFELLYSDPDFLSSSINIWGRKYYDTFDKMQKALTTAYNPLENYDRMEDMTLDHKGSSTGNSNGESTSGNTRTDDLIRTDDLTRTNDLTETHDLASTNDVTTTNDVSAYNDSNYAPKDKQIVDQDGSDTGTLTNTGTVTDTGTVTNTGTVTDEGTGSYNDNRSDSDEFKDHTTGRIHGNIGVTTSQQMLISELNLRSDYNIYDIIAEMFVKEFCIMVY